MHPRNLIILAALLAWPLSTSAAEKRKSAPAPEPISGNLTLASALARTLVESPELAAFSWDFRAAEARIIQARLKPNPELRLDVENPTGSGRFKSGDEMQHTLQLSQLIELGGKLPARLAVAEAERALANSEYQVKRVEVLKATTLAFVDVLAAQRRISLAEEFVKVADDAVQLTTQRVNVGKSSAVENTRANVAAASARIEVTQARRELLAAKARLAAQWGARRVDFDTVSGDLDRRKEKPALETLRTRLLGNPQLTRWIAEREKRQAMLAKEQAAAKPDITIAGGPRAVGKADDVSFVAGFSIPLPLRNRNQGAIAEARANLAKLEDERRAAEARAFAELSGAYQRLMGASEELTALEGSVIPGAMDAEKQLSDGYDLGRFTQFEVLDARKTLNAARAQQLKALAEYHKSLAEIEALTAQPVSLPHSAPATTKTTKRK